MAFRPNRQGHTSIMDAPSLPMKNNLKNSAFQYADSLRQKPASLIFAGLVAFLINPSFPTHRSSKNRFYALFPISLPDPSPYPVNSGTKPPYISAKFVYAIDTQSMTTIYLKILIKRCVRPRLLKL